MTLKEIEEVRRKWLDKHVEYKLLYWTGFDYTILHNIIYRRRGSTKRSETYNDVLIMADTETSKKPQPYKITRTKLGGEWVERPVYENHVVVWTISIRAFDRNIVTLYGRKPSEMMDCIDMIRNAMQGDNTIIYFHNMSYDYVFLRKFMFAQWGYPDKELATKPHYPILISFDNGLMFRDSLILVQRSLEKWADDLEVEHKKAVGKWDYDALRTQKTALSGAELEYIEHDTLAGVECLNALKTSLDKQIYAMPFTATGIPRTEYRKIARENNGRALFNRLVMTYDQYRKSEFVFHGGYVHANRHIIGIILRAICRDFSSSYPYVMLSEKYPMEAWTELGNKTVDFILENAEQYAFMFRFRAMNIELKDSMNPMPSLQFSKALKTVNATIDNGRILRAAYVDIYLNEIDLQVIADQYKWTSHICTEVHAATKGYLPRYLTDYVYKLYYDKCTLKGGDPVAYALAKSKLNSVYGMCVQHSIREELIEDYISGEYMTDPAVDPVKEYEKYRKNYNNVLLYQWGVWVTSYAMRNLFRLGKCVDYERGDWLYSDTDSIYASAWDERKLNVYNRRVIRKLKANGYDPVEYNGRTFVPGVAEFDKEYTEFVTLGAKRYCGRGSDGKLHITVAGVPKKGAACLNDDISNFRRGFIFPGEDTGKLIHTYIYKDDIETDGEGNETGDSIDLSACSYLLDSAVVYDWDELETDEVYIQVYEEDTEQ